MNYGSGYQDVAIASSPLPAGGRIASSTKRIYIAIQRLNSVSSVACEKATQLLGPRPEVSSGKTTNKLSEKVPEVIELDEAIDNLLAQIEVLENEVSRFFNL